MSADKKQILIADDDDDFRELLSMYLKSKGYDILNASDGIEALETAQSNPVDLILLDVNMPRMDGFQVAERLNLDMGADAPKIMIVTGRSLVEEDVAALLSGAVGALHKPFRMDELLKRVAKALAQTDEDSDWAKIQGASPQESAG